MRISDWSSDVCSSDLVEWYRKHPQIQDEAVDRPVFITGYGRSGTTILFEILSQDPQFRVARKWEGLFPCPPPEEESYTTDPRIAATEQVNAFIEGILPELGALHKIGGDLPIESLELEYLTFLRSEEHTSELQSLMRISYAVFC